MEPNSIFNTFVYAMASYGTWKLVTGGALVSAFSITTISGYKPLFSGLKKTTRITRGEGGNNPVRIDGHRPLKIHVNGAEYTGLQVIVDKERKLYLDGKYLETLPESYHSDYSNVYPIEVHGDVSSIVTQDTVEVSGNAERVDTQGSVTIGQNCNRVATQGSVTVKGDNTGNINTMGSVNVGGQVGGSISTMGPVNHR